MDELNYIRTYPKCKIGTMIFKTKEETTRTEVIPKEGWYCDSCGYYQRVILTPHKWERKALYKDVENLLSEVKKNKVYVE